MNQQIFFLFYNLAHKNVFFDKLVVFCADTLPYIVIVLALIFLVLHHDALIPRGSFREFAKKWKEISMVFFSGIFAWILAYFLKFFFQVDRPARLFSNVFPLIFENGYAFPSGHATFFSALAFSIFFSHKKAGYLFLSFAAIIGLARIVAGVHSPFDILGGFALGFLIAFLVKKV